MSVRACPRLIAMLLQLCISDQEVLEWSRLDTMLRSHGLGHRQPSSSHPQACMCTASLLGLQILDGGAASPLSAASWRILGLDYLPTALYSKALLTQTCPGGQSACGLRGLSREAAGWLPARPLVSRSAPCHSPAKHTATDAVSVHLITIWMSLVTMLLTLPPACICRACRVHASSRLANLALSSRQQDLTRLRPSRP